MTRIGTLLITAGVAIGIGFGAASLLKDKVSEMPASQVVAAPASPPAQSDIAKLQDEVNAESPAAEELIRSKLTDPESAQFRNVFAVRPQSYKSGFLFCGEVNAKNQFGGYVGFQPFLAVGQTAYLVTERGSIAENLFNSFCLQGKPLVRVSFD